jgi:Acetyl-coenzyme A synthetase N-terminus
VARELRHLSQWQRAPNCGSLNIHGPTLQGQKHQAVANWTPPEELRKACHISSKEQYDEMYKRSIDDPEGFWGDIANQFHWEKKVLLCSITVPCCS